MRVCSGVRAGGRRTMDEGDAFQYSAGGGVAAVRRWQLQSGALAQEHAPIGQFSKRSP